MEKYRNFSLFIILILIPDFPLFYYMLGGNLGSLLYRDVSVICDFSYLSVQLLLSGKCCCSNRVICPEPRPLVLSPAPPGTWLGPALGLDTLEKPDQQNIAGQILYCNLNLTKQIVKYMSCDMRKTCLLHMRKQRRRSFAR